MSTTDPLFIIAVNYNAYVQWCQKKGYAPHGGSVRYVRGLETLKGQSNIRILMILGWEGHKQAKLLRARASVVGRRPS